MAGSRARSARCRGLSWLLLLSWLAGGSAQGQTLVHRCREEARVVYQSLPCSGQVDAVREVAPDPQTPAKRRALQRVQRENQRRNAPASARVKRPAVRAAQRGGVRGAVISLHRDARACSRARAQRERALGGRARLDYLGRRQLDDRVFEACR